MFEEEKSEKTNICRNFVRFMEAVSYQPVSQATFFPPPSTSPLFTFQHARFSFRPKVFQTTEKLRWKIFSILLILLFTAKLFTADLGEVTFFAARFYICLRSFSIGEKKKKKKGKERIVEISSTTDLSCFFFLQLLKIDIQSVLFQFLFFPLLIYSFLLRRHFIRFAVNTKYLFQL